NIDEFEEKIKNKALVKDQEKACRYVKDVFKIMHAKVYTQKPTISRSETVYNTNMILPCFEMMLALMKKNEHVPYLVPSEDELDAMTAQLKEDVIESRQEKNI
ncbi:hypothetical protein EDC94DRAFT_529019, partial [Helicostylum pulchrum]